MKHLRFESLREIARLKGTTAEALLKQASIPSEARNALMREHDLGKASFPIKNSHLDRIAVVANCTPEALTEAPIEGRASKSVELDAIMGFLSVVAAALGIMTTKKAWLLLPAVVASALLWHAVYRRLNRERRRAVSLAVAIVVILSLSWFWVSDRASKARAVESFVIRVARELEPYMPEDDDRQRNAWKLLATTPPVILLKQSDAAAETPRGISNQSVVSVFPHESGIRVECSFSLVGVLHNEALRPGDGLIDPAEWSRATLTMPVIAPSDGLDWAKRYWAALTSVFQGQLVEGEQEFRELRDWLAEHPSTVMRPDCDTFLVATALLQNLNDVAVESGGPLLQRLTADPIGALRSKDRRLDWAVSILLLWHSKHTESAYLVSEVARSRFPSHYCFFAELEARLRVQEGGIANTAQVRAIARDPRAWECKERSLLELYDADLTIKYGDDALELDAAYKKIVDLDFADLTELPQREKAIQLTWDVGMRKGRPDMLRLAWKELRTLSEVYPDNLAVCRNVIWMAFDAGDLEYALLASRRATALSLGRQSGTFSNLFRCGEAQFILGAWSEAASTRVAAYDVLFRLYERQERPKEFRSTLVGIGIKAAVAQLLAGKRADAVNRFRDLHQDFPDEFQAQLSSLDNFVVGRLTDSVQVSESSSDATAVFLHALVESATWWRSSDIVGVCSALEFDGLVATLRNSMKQSKIDYNVIGIVIAAFVERAEVDASAEAGLSALLQANLDDVVGLPAVECMSLQERIGIRRRLQGVRWMFCQDKPSYSHLPLSVTAADLGRRAVELEARLSECDEISPGRFALGVPVDAAAAK